MCYSNGFHNEVAADKRDNGTKWTMECSNEAGVKMYSEIITFKREQHSVVWIDVYKIVLLYMTTWSKYYSLMYKLQIFKTFWFMYVKKKPNVNHLM